MNPSSAGFPEPPISIKRDFRSEAWREGLGIHQKGGVKDVHFFRNGYTADVVLKAGRGHNPILSLRNSSEIDYFHCSCSASPRKGRLCAHLAALVFQIFSSNGASGPPRLISHRYETCLWSILGKAFHEALKDAEITHALSAKGKTSAIATKNASGDCLCVFSFATDDILKDRVARALTSYPKELVKNYFPPSFKPPLGKELLLKRITLTENEAAMNQLGHKTLRQAWEESFWFRWSRRFFDLWEDGGNDVIVERAQRGFILKKEDERSGVSIQIFPGSAAMEKMLSADRNLFARNGFAVYDEKAELSFKVDFTEKNALALRPVIIPLEGGHQGFYQRNDLEPWRYGKYFFLEKLGGFVSAKPHAPFFLEPEARNQSSFVFSGQASPSPFGIPTDKETMVPQEKLMDFIRHHREELGRMREDLVPDSIRHAVPVDPDMEATCALEPEEGSWLNLSILYKANNANISFWDILEARKSGRDFLITDNCWINVKDNSFRWMDGVSGKAFVDEKGAGKIRLSQREFLLLRSRIGSRISYTGGKDIKSLIQKMDEFALPGPLPDEKALGMELFDYQTTGYHWLRFLYHYRLGGLLCDDMGLGKTHQAMALMRFIRLTMKKGRPCVLVVSPTSVTSHWMEKMESYLPELTASLYHGNKRKLENGTDIIVTSYATLRNDIEVFKKHFFHAFILDEIQMLKNRSTATYQALDQIRRDFTLGLTGTPVENSVMDLKNLMDFVLPGFLPGQKDFEREFANPMENHADPKAGERLRRIVHPFILRRTKSQVLQELPDKIEDKRYCLLTEDQVKLYKDILETKSPALLQKLSEEKNIPYIHIFAVLNYLKQICNHPAMLANNPFDLNAYSSGKWDLFLELLQECLDSGLKVVVFSQYVRMLKLMEFHLKENNISFTGITGSTIKRKEALKRFRDDPDCKVFLSSLKAGGLGIDLTAASVVIHYDRWWNQAREDQATDRVHRKGQTKGVQVIKLITRGTLEERIDALIQKKGDILKSVVREDAPSLSKQFTPNELKSLLTLVPTCSY